MKQILQTFFIAMLFSACSLDIPLEDKVTDPWAITDTESAMKALSTVYSNYEQWKSMIPITALSDDCMPTPYLSKAPVLRGIYRWDRVKMAELANGIWQGHYATIMHSNALIERLLLIKNVNEKDRQTLQLIEKEAKAIKALCYFQLMQMFAPRYLPDKAKKQLGVVYKGLVKLEYNPRMSLEATADTVRRLTEPYMNEKKPLSPSLFRFSPTATLCLRAELELWTGNYEKVISLCKPITDKYNTDEVRSDLYERFWAQTSSDVNEAIFSIDYTAFSAASFFDEWILDDRDLLVVNSTVKYEESDTRRTASVTPVELYANAAVHKVLRLGKYNTLRMQSKHIRYVSIYRMADFVFLCAEAYARTGKPDKARFLMNRYLRSRKVTEIPPQTGGEALIKCILDEKQKEFLGEGKRYLDLKRTEYIPIERNLLLDDPLETIAPDDFRRTFPIPVSEVKYNKVPQNRGWEFLVIGV